MTDPQPTEDAKLKSTVEFLFSKTFPGRTPLTLAMGKYIIKMWKLEWFAAWLQHYAEGNKSKKYSLLLQLYRKNHRHYPPKNFHEPYRKIRRALHLRLESEIDRFKKQKKQLNYKRELKQYFRERGLSQRYKAGQHAGLKYQH